jgi:hypothetical protein
LKNIWKLFSQHLTVSSKKGKKGEYGGGTFLEGKKKKKKKKKGKSEL